MYSCIPQAACGVQWPQRRRGFWVVKEWQGSRQGKLLVSAVGHLLVGEDTCDAAVCGSKHGQQAVPEGNRGVRSQACLLCARPPSQPQPPATHSHSQGGGGAYVLRSWSRHTRSTNCCVMPVSKIKLCRRKLLPGREGKVGRMSHCACLSLFRPVSGTLVETFPMPWSRPCLLVSRLLWARSPPALLYAPTQMPCHVLTLLGVRSHFLHELNEVFQEFSVVV